MERWCIQNQMFQGRWAMTNACPITPVKNGPIQEGRNVPIHQLVHTHNYQKRISKKRVEEIAIEKYRKYGKGIDFTDVIREGPSSKEKSQRILKDCCRERMDKRGELQKPILFRAPTRTSPQQFFPTAFAPI